MKQLKELFETRNLCTINSGCTVNEAAHYMAESGVGLVPVLNNNNLIGVFSERDLVKRVIAKGKDINTTLIDDVMSKDLVIADINETPDSVFMKMRKAGTRHILIVDNEKLVGVLSARDILEMDLNTCKSTVDVLNNYIYAW